MRWLMGRGRRGRQHLLRRAAAATAGAAGAGGAALLVQQAAAEMELWRGNLGKIKLWLQDRVQE